MAQSFAQHARALESEFNYANNNRLHLFPGNGEIEVIVREGAQNNSKVIAQLKIGLQYDLKDGENFGPVSFTTHGETSDDPRSYILLFDKKHSEGIYAYSKNSKNVFYHIPDINKITKIKSSIEIKKKWNEERYYWEIRSSDYFLNKFTNEFPGLNRIREEIILCLDSKDKSCKEKLFGDDATMKFIALEGILPDSTSTYYNIQKVINWDSTIFTNSIKSCIKDGRIMREFKITKSQDSKSLEGTLIFYNPSSKIQILNYGIVYLFECQLTVIKNQNSKTETVRIKFNRI